MRLLTISRWASNEWMYPAGEVVPIIDRFELSGNTPPPDQPLAGRGVAPLPAADRLALARAQSRLERASED
jgi:hypothetical protein